MLWSYALPKNNRLWLFQFTPSGVLLAGTYESSPPPTSESPYSLIAFGNSSRCLQPQEKHIDPAVVASIVLTVANALVAVTEFILEKV